MGAPVGAVVGIYYDSPREVRVDDAITTKTGRVYIVVSVRRQARGIHTGRWHLRCLVAREVPEGARVLPLRWYRRKKRVQHGT